MKELNRARFHFLECMERINRAIQQADDVEQMLWNALETAYSIFDCDRIWLLYPCDPKAPTFRIPVEIFRKEYPGALALNQDIPMWSLGEGFCTKVLETEGPVVFRSDTDPPIFHELAEQFGVRSQVIMAIYPRVGKPWMFGMHQCSYDRTWSRDEQELFEGIGRRIAEGLSALLLLRDLRETQERFDLAVKGSRDGLWDWPDVNQDAMWWSPRVYEMLGRNPGEIAPAASTLMELVHPDDLEKVRLALRHRFKDDGEQQELRFRIRNGSGETRWLLARGMTVAGNGGESRRMSGSFQDVTDATLAAEELRQYQDRLEELVEERMAELKAINAELEATTEALREREEQLRILFENSPLGIVLLDPGDLRFVRFNQKAHEFLKYSREEFTSLGMVDIDANLPPEDARDRQWLAQKSGWHQYETLGRAKDGSLLELQLTGQMIQIGGKPYLLQIFEDISARKAMEAELIRAKESADEANRAKSEFLAVMSHEIRTPLSVVIASIDHLLHTTEDSEQKAILELADSSADSLHSLIEDILDFSRIEARRVEIRRDAFDLRGCIEKIIEMFRMQAQGKGLRLRYTIDPQVPATIHGDPDRLTQVLINLVGNAMKFTHQGEVAIRVGVRPDSLILSVRDTGIGIAEDKRDRLFQSFSQVDSSLTRKYGGTGLGLAISKALVDLMGGTIWVESAPGKGSVFSFTLPAWSQQPEDSREARAAAGEEVQENLQRRQAGRVLLVDDDPRVRKIVTMTLAERHWEVTTVTGGREALELLREEAFDLILMDLQMPDMSGLDVTREIREREKSTKGRRTPIVALTAHALLDHKKSCLEVGMDDFLSKPASREKLFEVVEKYLEPPPEDDMESCA
ncbi:hypothetical protein DESUT3_13280 [Desulfuromonas versatilis]|uniref:histidine kinase n=1 Tax=Desulfuromonas versatilis TaxID=2802975 RepID=A0ABN6DWM3_9BACT|nr:ATP-binding protein [Desulfuromonas versatilis]BCR04259.1 hypothetical protein DESUT3_13280 [Desulfuromonas versatilis]